MNKKLFESFSWIFRLRPFFLGDMADQLWQRRAYTNTKNKNSAGRVRERPIPTEYRRFSAKSVPTFEDRECHMVSVTEPMAVFSTFLTGAATFSFQ
jgi:hypothetical protein